MTVDPGILTGLGLLAFVGLVLGLGLLGAWLLAPRAAEPEIPAPDVDLAERTAPFTPRPADVTNVRVLRPGDRPRLSHDPATCDACADLDRGGF